MHSRLVNILAVFTVLSKKVRYTLPFAPPLPYNYQEMYVIIGFLTGRRQTSHVYT